MTPAPTPFLPLLSALPLHAERFWPRANRRLLWGWKRDVAGDSRLVFYSARLARRGETVGVTDQHLLYVHSTRPQIAEEVHRTFQSGRPAIEATIGPLVTSLRPKRDGRVAVEASIGSPGAEELRLTAKLRRRRPRRTIAAVPDVEPCPLLDLDQLFPADLYVGSGLSYEAGLPTLCDMHDAFCVDDPTGTRFATGRDDTLPEDLTRSPATTIARFCAVHTGALTAQPTAAMHTIAALRDVGLVGDVYTDNVDNLLAKTGTPFVRTRGSGVLNERCEVELPSPRLIIVGVAADRREVVAQARAKRRRVVVVNSCERVAPHVRHLTYLRPSDRFFRTTADTFFAAAAAATGLVARELVAAA
jgi:hypothetical protein